MTGLIAEKLEGKLHGACSKNCCYTVELPTTNEKFLFPKLSGQALRVDQPLDVVVLSAPVESGTPIPLYLYGVILKESTVYYDRASESPKSLEYMPERTELGRARLLLHPD